MVKFKALQLKPALAAFPYTSWSSLTYEGLTKHQMGETDWNPATCLLVSGPGNKALSFLKGQSNSIDFYECQAASPCSVTYHFIINQ